MPRPIKSAPRIPGRLPVKGRILQAIMCECEEEARFRIRVARDPKKGCRTIRKIRAATWTSTHTIPGMATRRARAGEWAEGRVICSGSLKRVRARRIEMAASILTSGARLVERVHVDGAVEIDFGRSKRALPSKTTKQRRKILKERGSEG